MSDSDAPRRKATTSFFDDLDGMAFYTIRQFKFPASLYVWLSLFARANRKTQTVRVGRATLEQETGYSKRMVEYALKDLIALDLVKQVTRGSSLTGPSTYKVRGVKPGGRRVGQSIAPLAATHCEK